MDIPNTKQQREVLAHWKNFRERELKDSMGSLMVLTIVWLASQTILNWTHRIKNFFKIKSGFCFLQSIRTWWLLIVIKTTMWHTHTVLNHQVEANLVWSNVMIPNQLRLDSKTFELFYIIESSTCAVNRKQKVNKYPCDTLCMTHTL